MPKHSGKWVSYLRVSTDRQGKSGLGLEAQREAVANYLNGGQWTLAAELVEVEGGKRNDRPQLTAALALCKKLKAKLIVARLDRLSRNLAFLAKLIESGVTFVAADMPHANKMTLQVLAVFAEHEREAISARTKAALQAAKARGVTLGGPKLAEARRNGWASNKASADRSRLCPRRCRSSFTQLLRASDLRRRSPSKGGSGADAASATCATYDQRAEVRACR